MVSLSKILLIGASLELCLEDNDGLTMVFHLFVVGQNIVSVRKDLCTCSEHCNLVACGIGTTVIDAVPMIVPNSVDLPTALRMARGSLARTCLVLYTFLSY